ncbi:unnamed protein product [Medioppia subpectinata]|uniref:Uncharacterized protein n=1 Tax=Medioppia subpectinata TaxID=1979941 RepID=A0A7R9Q2T8_9ACAR|nr:unnamed protein product [Medioppia subpectinata]CAG2110734.1 unnamed protein product [Medioppia subpectinata]
MASNGWETVGKKKATKGSVKGQKKRPVFDGTDHSEPTAPITIADTNFKLLNDLEDRKATKLNHQNHTKTGNGSNNNHKSVVDQNRDNESIDKKSSPKPKPKKKATTAGVTDSPPPKSAPNKPLTFEQLAKELKVSEFESVSEETKLKFPDMPLIWLKDIAYFLNGKFPSVEPEDVTFADKSIGN